jgi:predicted dehydrogenase
MRFKALVIGAGNVGAFFDAPGDENVLSHAHAYVVHPGFELLGFVDTDSAKAAKAASVWGCEHFKSLEDAFTLHEIDVISVAVPDDWHYEILKAVSAYPLSAVIAEKPITKSIDQGKEIARLYREKGMPIAVNYARRYVPHFIGLNQRIHNGEFGRYLAGSGYYGKGLVHNGSHLVDLLRLLIDEVEQSRVFSVERDFYADDPSIEAVLLFRCGRRFHLQTVPCHAYTIFEVDLFFERGRVRIVDSGFHVEEYGIKDSEAFAGYQNLSMTGQAPTEMGKSLWFLVDNVYQHLLKGASIMCTAEDAVRDLEVCTALAASFRLE